MKIKITKKLLKEADDKGPSGTEKYVSKGPFKDSTPRTLNVYPEAEPTQKQSEEEIKQALAGEIKDPGTLERVWNSIKSYFSSQAEASMEPEGTQAPISSPTPEAPEIKPPGTPGKITMPDLRMPGKLAPQISPEELAKWGPEHEKKLADIEQRQTAEDPLDPEDPDFSLNYDYDEAGLKRPKGVMKPLQEIAKRHFKTEK